MPLESAITKKILKALRENVGGVWWKIHGGPHQARGIPDIVGCYKGLFYGLEVKRPEKRDNVTSLQRETLSNIRVRGRGLAIVVTSVDEAVKFVTTTSELTGSWAIELSGKALQDKDEYLRILEASYTPSARYRIKPKVGGKIRVIYSCLVEALQARATVEELGIDGLEIDWGSADGS